MTINKSAVHPVHEHDCTCCVFYGNYIYKEQVFDLYHCPEQKTSIARFGVDGDYISAPDFMSASYQAKDEAHPIAQVVGLRAVNERLELNQIIDRAAELQQ